MSDLGNQIRDHYDAQSLPPAKVEAILARGRAAAAGETEATVLRPPQVATRRRRLLALAAAVLLFAGLGVFWLLPAGADYAASRPAVIGFFANKPMYGMMSEQPAELRKWTIEQGAPPAFQIPPKLAGLVSKGCTVMNVDGKPAYLLCFMTSDASGKQDGGMVHLLVARRLDFRNAPASGAPSIITADGWSFASWAEGGIVYTIAAPLSPEALHRYVFSRGADAPRHPLRLATAHAGRPALGIKPPPRTSGLYHALVAHRSVPRSSPMLIFTNTPYEPAFFKVASSVFANSSGATPPTTLPSDLPSLPRNWMCGMPMTPNFCIAATLASASASR